MNEHIGMLTRKIGLMYFNLTTVKEIYMQKFENLPITEFRPTLPVTVILLLYHHHHVANNLVL